MEIIRSLPADDWQIESLYMLAMRRLHGANAICDRWREEGKLKSRKMYRETADQEVLIRADVAALFLKVDTDKDGFISREEYFNFRSENVPEDQSVDEGRFEAEFADFDKNGDGTIDFEEMVESMLPYKHFRE